MRSRVLVASIAAALLGVAVWGCFGLTRHIIVAVDKWGDAGAGLTETAAKLNGPHGTIAMLDEDVGATKSLIVHADLVARHEQQQLSTWDADTTALFANLNGGITDLRGLVGALTGTANAATGTLNAVNDPKTGIGPTVANVNGTVSDLRTTIPELERALSNTADAAQHTAGTIKNIEATTGDIQAKLHPILNPEPCKTRACRIKRDFETVKALGPGAEGLYYLIEIGKDIF